MSEIPLEFSDLDLMDPQLDSKICDFNTDAFDFNSNYSAFDSNADDDADSSVPDGLSHLDSNTVQPGSGEVREPSPDFKSPVDVVTDELLAEQMTGNADPLFDDFVGSEDFSHPQSSSYSQYPASEPIAAPPKPFIPPTPILRPCSPPSGLPVHLPRLRPCSPPPGMPAHLLRPSEPSRWTSCAPLPDFPGQLPHPRPGPASVWVPCSPPPTMPAQMVFPPPVVARTPWHHPGVSKRLGLQTGKRGGKGGRRMPRSVPANGKVLSVSPAIDPSLLMSSQAAPLNTVAIRPAPSPGRAGDESHSNTQSSIIPPSRPRRGSIHLEDLYGSDEDTDSTPSSATPNLGKRKRSGSASDVEAKKRKMRKLLAEIQDTDEFIGGKGIEVETADDESDDKEFAPQWLPRERNGSVDGTRRSRRAKKAVDYAESED